MQRIESQRATANHRPRRFRRGPAGVACPRDASFECRSVRAQALALAALLTSGCTLLAPPEEREAPPDAVFSNISVDHYRNGRLDARGHFDELRHHTRERRLEADGVLWEPVDDAGRRKGRLVAEKGNALPGDSLVNLHDGLVYEAGDGSQLHTTTARIDIASETASGSDKTLLIGDGFRSTGSGFAAQGGNDGWLRLEGDVETIFDDAVAEHETPAVGSDSTRAADTEEDSAPARHVAPNSPGSDDNGKGGER